MKRAVVTVAVSQARVLDLYVARWIKEFSRYARGEELLVWDKLWPPGSPSHHECNYAFKVHAVHEAKELGYTSILWCDASCTAFAPLAPMWERLERDGHVLIEDANPLGKWSSDRSLAQFGVTRDEAMDIRLMCGTCWGLDLTVERSRIFLERLRSLASPDNFNGTHRSRLPGLAIHPRPGSEGALVSTDERCWGHRSDEVYMSLLAKELGMQTHVGVEFIGGCGSVTERACIRSGYDL
jgi:hypothetical protein